MKKQLEKRGFMYNLRRAFTITELVIVIAVVAVLAAVLIPTFSNVIENSKRSHDEQFVKEINVALSAYNTKHGKTPEDYPELMSALDEAGLCDSSNYFLLGTKLKQKDMYLIWYKNANSVVLLDGSESSDYIIQFTPSIDMGNAVYVFDKTAAGGTQIGYALCTTGMKDGEYFAQLYKDFYEESAGSLDTFFEKFGNKYSAENILGSVNNAAWGNNVIDALKNQKQGYAYSESTANSIRQQAATGSTVNIGITELPENPTADQVTQVQQEVRSALATLTTLANTSVDAAALEGTTIVLASKESDANTALADVTVDMSEVQMTAIGNVYRKTYQKAESIDAVTGSFSVNFGGLTIENMHVAQSELVSSGAEYQPEDDCSYPGGAYVFTYGLFGTVNAKEGTVTISNINVKGVDMDLNGATESIGGQTYPTISDMAGIIAGYTQGSVVFENITIDGAKTVGAKGLLSGFDGVAGLVGRAYGKGDAGTAEGTVTIRNCDISNMVIKGQRRAAGFVAYAGIQANVVIEDSTLTNVDIICERTDKKSGAHGGAIGHFSTQNAQQGTNTTCVFDGVVLTDVTTEISYSDAEGKIYSFPNADASNALSASKFYYAKVGDSYISIIMSDSNPLDNEASDGSDKVIQGDGLKIVANGVTYNVTSLTRGVAAVFEEV